MLTNYQSVCRQMSSKSANSLNDTILMQAADWFAVLQSGEVNKEDENLWQEWLMADALHRQAWIQIEQVSGSFQKLKDRSDSQATRALLAKTKRTKLSAVIVQNLFIFCFVCFVAAVGWYQLTPNLIASSEIHYQTAIGEINTIKLHDGTTITLNTNTRVRTVYSEKLRRIVVTSGEIMVTTAPDNIQPARPMVIDTADGRLTPIGTRFTVRHLNQTTELNVFEGAVKIQPHKANSTTVITAGRQGLFDENRIIESELDADHSREAWTSGILIADNMPLCDFVSELNRYRQGNIICSNDISDLKLVGAYPLSDTYQIISAIESSLPVNFWQVNEKIWRVDSRR